MRFTVHWTDTALEQLTLTWIENEERTAVSRAQYRIDQLLRNDPRTRVIPLPGRYFKLDAPPIQVLFEINENDRLVTVVSVRLLPKGTSE